MKKVLLGAFVAVACYCGSASAGWFIFPIPGQLVGKISDAFTGAEGEHCVPEIAKVGDVIPSPSGNSATIVSLSGKSNRCRNPQLPIRAKLQFNYSFSSKAGIEIPDGFEPKPLNDNQRFEGLILIADNPLGGTGMTVSARTRDNIPDPAELLRFLANNLKATLDNAASGDVEQIEIDGMPAWRMEVTGKKRGFFGQRFTYMYTAIQGDKEVVVVNVYSLTDDYEKRKPGLRKVSESIKGIKAAVADAVPPAAPPQADTAPVAAPDKQE